MQKKRNKKKNRKKLPIAASINIFTKFSLILFINQVCIAVHLIKSDSEWYTIIK